MNNHLCLFFHPSANAVSRHVNKLSPLPTPFISGTRNPDTKMSLSDDLIIALVLGYSGLLSPHRPVHRPDLTPLPLRACGARASLQGLSAPSLQRCPHIDSSIGFPLISLLWEGPLGRCNSRCRCEGLNLISLASFVGEGAVHS